ncbi:phage holin family protein [Phormidesmis priestleyi ULC007]|uniref:Phage holin family protein n=1 Tax=Phormidesmis priestleyi ULC007 TaxID=1920490 RepID=A0A2T1D8F4_9CYAN|nr:phage holin family protein [Phormidesmis priestleyi]PSB16716.1 phage holin family protein [Phormidesmis priestleyi ULC007]PZO47583.1 MAG: phage holin family protein [Phormidesmis priestleyi]
MLGYFFVILSTALSLLVVDIVLPGVNIASFPSALIAGVSIGLVNAFVKPILSLLTLPINFLTLGLFALVVNGICFSLAAALTPGFSVHGTLAFILGPVILSFASTFLNKYFAERTSAPKLESTSDLKTEV